MNKEYIKSPLVYQGGKYSMLKKIIPLFPKDINNFYDVFGGSGVVSLNVDSKQNHYNEFNEKIYSIIEYFNKDTKEQIMDEVMTLHDTYHLRKSSKDDSKELQEEKKYWFLKFRDMVNENYELQTPLAYFVMHLYSFNNLIRFNQKGGFNAPYGYTTGRGEKVLNDILPDILDFGETSNKDFEDFLNNIEFEENDFVYLDPPYTGTTAVYNENRLTGWNYKDDERLFKLLNTLNEKGVKWAMSNTLTAKDGTFNGPLVKWICDNKWEVHNFDKKYVVFGHSNTKNKEVLICNYNDNVR